MSCDYFHAQLSHLHLQAQYLHIPIKSVHSFYLFGVSLFLKHIVHVYLKFQYKPNILIIY